MISPSERPLVLSLFPGIGLLDMAFELEGFCVVRGPDLLWGGDIRAFHPPAGRFDGVIGGPPCQAFSRLVHIVRANGHRVAPNLIPEFSRVLREAAPAWWIMENVPGAPVPNDAKDAILLRDSDCGGLTSRERRISWGGVWLDFSDLRRRSPLYPAVVRDAREQPVAIGGSGKPKRRRNQVGGTAPHEGKAMALSEMLHRQGFPREMLDECPLTSAGARSAVGNGVPLPMGRAIAKAVKRAMGYEFAEATA
jgi:DNA (cytosine-5)-methyltransferase 1